MPVPVPVAVALSVALWLCGSVAVGPGCGALWSRGCVALGSVGVGAAGGLSLCVCVCVCMHRNEWTGRVGGQWSGWVRDENGNAARSTSHGRSGPEVGT